MEIYRGYKIESENGHYKVTSPNNEVWREDNKEEAKKSIDGDILMNADE